jgi:hypothetical protein
MVDTEWNRLPSFKNRLALSPPKDETAGTGEQAREKPLERSRGIPAARGLDIETKNFSVTGRGRSFFVDIPFYRTAYLITRCFLESEPVIQREEVGIVLRGLQKGVPVTHRNFFGRQFLACCFLSQLGRWSKGAALSSRSFFASLALNTCQESAANCPVSSGQFTEVVSFPAYEYWGSKCSSSKGPAGVFVTCFQLCSVWARG